MSTLRTFDYALVDVFAERPLEGNALAIVSDARGLSSVEMQAIARETNLAETTFILPRDPAVEAEHGVQVRIFTVQEELRFAGHPTLGTASWLYWNHPIFRGALEIALDLVVGRIPVTFSGNEASAGTLATMRQNDPAFGTIHAPEAVAQALGLTVADLDPALPIQTVSTGMAFCIVPLRSMEVAAQLDTPHAVAQRYLDSSDAKLFYCITKSHDGSDADWHARMQWSTGEDPATGSAAGCAIAYLVQHGRVASGLPAVIEQGVEMLRPSRIHVRATRDGDSVSGVFVGGRTIPVATGRLIIP